MKKILLLSVFAFMFSMFVSAQVNSNAIGLRFGAGSFGGAELSYQRGLGSNRLEFDFGWNGNSNHNRMFLAGIFHWDWNIVEGLNWFVGPGACVGYYHYKGGDSYLGVALGGQIGLEYDFNTLGVPILLSLDSRPMWDFIGENAGFWWGAALAVRYTF
ncbi:MAG TPA: hypothetical protein PLG05_03420 [Bacteroidales bacterium]|nr:hypothetical protein [Bacteroidales bacterium]HOR59975.1 hypothetical protein [Bacteroidales bacterium]HPL04203.1 hypothetical protein [Bacteroidales bacterium]